MVRSLDAIHLATHAILLQTHPDSIFLTSDRKLRDAAKAMGFAYFDPTE
jgi:CHAT domain-containing protein